MARKCVGCGFCCFKAQCWVSLRVHGYQMPCPSLYWNEETKNYRCKQIELSVNVYEELYAGEGCCMGLNNWRIDVKRRLEIDGGVKHE